MEDRKSLTVTVAYCAGLCDGFKALLQKDLVDWEHKPMTRTAVKASI